MRLCVMSALLFALSVVVPLHADSTYQLTLTGGGNTIVFTQPSSWSFEAGNVLIQVPGQSGPGTFNGVPDTISDTFFFPFLADYQSAVIGGIDLWGEQVVQWLAQDPSPLGFGYLDTVGIEPGTYYLETDPYLNPFLNPPPVQYTLVIGPASAAAPEPASLILLATALLAGGICWTFRETCSRCRAE